MILLALACVSRASLTSADPLVRAAALDDLSSVHARALVPQLAKWATLSAGHRDDVSAAALRALVRADTEPALAVVRVHADRPDPEPAIRALLAEPTRRSCDLLGELRVAAACDVVAADRLACPSSWPAAAREATCSR